MYLIAQQDFDKKDFRIHWGEPDNNQPFGILLKGFYLNFYKRMVFNVKSRITMKITYLSF